MSLRDYAVGDSKFSDEWHRGFLFGIAAGMMASLVIVAVLFSF